MCWGLAKKHFNALFGPGKVIELDFPLRKNEKAVKRTPGKRRSSLTDTVVRGKSTAQMELIVKAIKSNALLHTIDARRLRNMVDLMAPLDVSAGEILIQQGDKGEDFYVVEVGKFEVQA